MRWSEKPSAPVLVVRREHEQHHGADRFTFEGGYTREEYASLYLLGHLTTYITAGAGSPDEIRAHLIELANTMAREWCASREPKEQP